MPFLFMLFTLGCATITENRVRTGHQLALPIVILSRVVWGHRLADWIVAGREFFAIRFPSWNLASIESIPLVAMTAACTVIGFGLGWWILRERIRPIDENPVSGFIRFIYAARLRFALKHKLLMLAFPAFIIFVGAGAWVGFPTLLMPVEM